MSDEALQRAREEWIEESRNFIGLADAGEKTTVKYEMCKVILALASDVERLMGEKENLIYYKREALATMRQLRNNQKRRAEAAERERGKLEIELASRGGVLAAVLIERDNLQALVGRLRAKVIELGGTLDE